MSIQNSLCQVPINVLNITGPMYLENYGFSEIESAIWPSVAMGIGIIASILINLSRKIRLWLKICYLLISASLILIGLSTILNTNISFEHGYDGPVVTFWRLEMIFGLSMLGVASSGVLNMSSLIPVTIFPMIDCNVLLVVPFTVSMGLCNLACYIMIYAGDWGMLGLGVFFLVFWLWLVFSLPKDP
jgi:hypothetical protein